MVPHPNAPIVVTYGIENHAKLWSTLTSEDLEYKPPMGINESEFAKLSGSSGGSKNPDGNNKENYNLCFSDGVKDRERYNRISLPISPFYGDRESMKSMYYLPSTLECNKVVNRVEIIPKFLIFLFFSRYRLSHLSLTLIKPLFPVLLIRYESLTLMTMCTICGYNIYKMC